MSDAQMISASLVFAAVLTAHALSRVTTRLDRLEKQNERKLDMLIALLKRNGINPVTLD